MRKLSSDFWAGALIALAPLLLISGCWRDGFLPYDDSYHVFAHLGPFSFSELFLLPQPEVYLMPITFLSYRLDHFLFEWMAASPSIGSWAPGVRLMTCVYHAGAALFIWKIAGLLGLSRGKALFVALAFAVHPTVCETVCWSSERKNALAALFGFASLWTFLRFEGNKWRMALVVLLYVCALWSKPTALGFLPLLMLADVFGGVEGLRGNMALPLKTVRYWLGLAWRFLPLILFSASMLALNLACHSWILVPHIGGTRFTTLLTDAEVFSRYLFNIFAPIQLSIAYFVAPIRSPFELRFISYAALLIGVIAGSVWLAPNRRLAAFGWLWFFAAMAPVANMVSIPQVMQDRYVYFSLPAALLVSAVSFGGLMQRFQISERLAATAAIAFVVALAALGVERGGLFGNLYLLFADGVQKQPLSAHAHHGLGIAYARISDTARKENRQKEMDDARHAMGRELLYFVFECPDATRLLEYLDTAWDAGKYALIINQPNEAERCFRLITNPPPGVAPDRKLALLAYARLSGIKLSEGKTTEACDLAGQAIALGPTDGEALLADSIAALALATTTTDPHRKEELRQQAENDLRYVPASSPKYAQAQEQLKLLGH